MTTNRTAKDIAELAAIAIKESNWTHDLRWTLEDTTYQEYVDEAKGGIWDTARDIATSKGFEENGLTGHWDADRKYRAEHPQPEKHPVKNWYLHNNYMNTSIELSQRLGEELDRVWTKSPRWKGEAPTQNVIALSLSGMLKRLGVKTIDKQVKEYEAERERIQKLKNRPYLIKEINLKLNEVIKHLASLDDQDFLNSGMSVAEMLSITTFAMAEQEQK